MKLGKLKHLEQEMAGHFHLDVVSLVTATWHWAKEVSGKWPGPLRRLNYLPSFTCISKNRKIKISEVKFFSLSTPSAAGKKIARLHHARTYRKAWGPRHRFLLSRLRKRILSKREEAMGHSGSTWNNGCWVQSRSSSEHPRTPGRMSVSPLLGQQAWPAGPPELESQSTTFAIIASPMAPLPVILAASDMFKEQTPLTRSFLRIF